MKNNYSLQLLRHDEVFTTREEAFQYLSDFYKPNSLDAEPVIVKYGEARNPNVILAFGTSNAGPGSYYAIDMTKTLKDVEELSEEIEGDTEKIEKLAADLMNVVAACGLTIDPNKIQNQISYEPDPHDAIIGSATTIAEAIRLLSTYAQESAKQGEMSVEDTSSVHLVYEVNPSGGKTLKASVKISTNGDSDELGFNNNIIGIKNDGLYAASHLAYDDVRNELIFTTSGYKNGRFQDDAIVERVNLGKHIQLLPDTTDTLETVITEVTDGLVEIGGNVKLGSTNSIVVRNGGLEANITVDVDVATNSLIVNVGNERIVKHLPGVNVVESSWYDDATQIIYIKFKGDETPLQIPVGDLVHSWDVYNDPASPVVLTRRQVSGGEDTLSGTLKLRSTDNLLGLDNGSLYVAKSNLYNRAEIDERFDYFNNAKANVSDVYNKQEIDGRFDFFNNAKANVTDVYTKSEVDDLIYTLEVENKEDSPVILTINDANEKLSASLSILNDSHNLLQNRNGALFVDSDSNHHYALYGGEETTVQQAINRLKEKTNEIDAIHGEVTDIQTNLQNVREDIANVVSDVENAQANIITLRTDLQAEHTDRVDVDQDIYGKLYDYSLEVARLSEKVNNFETRIDDAVTRAANAEARVNELSRALGPIDENAKTVEERLEAIEQWIIDAIDFGQYQNNSGL